MLPAEEAFNFLLFCVRNPKPCPILDVLEPGQVEPLIAPGADLRKDLPRYKIFEQGEFKTDAEDVSDYFNENMVSFLLGCSFSFENAMLAAGCTGFRRCGDHSARRNPRLPGLRCNLPTGGNFRTAFPCHYPRPGSYVCFGSAG